MEIQTIIKTKRLILRPFELSDSKIVQKLAGDSKIAETTLNIPHPYEDGMAESWINTHKDNLINETSITYAIVENETGELIGAISLMGINKVHKKAELGYWIGVPYWGKGYCTDASQAIVEFGFKELNLNRIYALAFESNKGSWRVMEKMGMKYEGTRRQDVVKNGRFKDLRMYSILLEEFNAKS
ncbi:GNAT family N-acetyltransferase [Tissierella sp.]|uniref:GNAT family N-acetyltransferase n=1 Tax=Tissierella sp. TaxID=41274 RepID=UPI00285FF558|nr:GNAT family N-acetyltransferase [Tissierella sp.]MDR7856742.1 GNAT family N-acetyltransferase [Tissierella sp.]